MNDQITLNVTISFLDEWQENSTNQTQAGYPYSFDALYRIEINHDDLINQDFPPDKFTIYQVEGWPPRLKLIPLVKRLAVDLERKVWLLDVTLDLSPLFPHS